MRIRIQEHPEHPGRPEQVFVTLQTGPRSYITLPAMPVSTDWPNSREYDIPSLNLTSLDVSFGGPTQEPQR